MKKLEPFRSKPKDDILQEPYLQDIIERNMEVAAQAVIDIANRMIALESLEKPRDYHEAILRLGQAGILPMHFAKHLAPIAGFRNVLVHDYLDIDRDEVFRNLQQLEDLERFADHIKDRLRQVDTTEA